MHDLFEISCSTGKHPVRLTAGTLADTVAACGATVVLADSFFREALAGVAVPVIFIDAVEESKDFAAMPALVERCRKHGLTRDGMIAAVGGGVVQDIACFVASVYMRGIKWTYVPTTLLSMVDSCIGGKSSINVGEFKNLVGTFYPPAAVVVLPSVTTTLPPEHIAAGRAEAAKICFAHDDATFDRYVAVDGGTFDRDPGSLIALSLGAKKWFVETDEFDHAERLLLNFGHSFGHALESCSAYAVPHGVGVGVGCLAAVEMSCAAVPGLAAHPRVQRLRKQMRAILAPVEGLGHALRQVRREEFFRYWNSDKKHSQAHYRPILLDSQARLYRAALPRDEATMDRIWQAFIAASKPIGALACAA